MITIEFPQSFQVRFPYLDWAGHGQLALDHAFDFLLRIARDAHPDRQYIIYQLNNQRLWESRTPEGLIKAEYVGFIVSPSDPVLNSGTLGNLPVIIAKPGPEYQMLPQESPRL